LNRTEWPNSLKGADKNVHEPSGEEDNSHRCIIMQKQNQEQAAVKLPIPEKAGWSQLFPP
jgi:hypothetical protein